MITNKNISSILDDLDNALGVKKLYREFTIFGSGALLLQNIASKDRATVDIDMLDPEIDTDLQLISMDISAKHGLEISWLNSAGYIFSKNFPKGWQERSIEVYKGQSLTVFSLSRKDLIASKVLAFCQRQSNTDLIDLKSLAPKDTELTFTKEWLSARPDFEAIKSTFVKLKSKLEDL